MPTKKESQDRIEGSAGAGVEGGEPVGRAGRDGGAVRPLVEIDAPRDRAGTFEPQIVRKRQRRFEGFDDKILALYARGLSTRDIEAHLHEIYRRPPSCQREKVGLLDQGDRPTEAGELAGDGDGGHGRPLVALALRV